MERKGLGPEVGNSARNKWRLALRCYELGYGVTFSRFLSRMSLHDQF